MPLSNTTFNEGILSQCTKDLKEEEVRDNKQILLNVFKMLHAFGIIKSSEAKGTTSQRQKSDS